MESTKEKVILQLPGIEKRWVYHNGQWVDAESIKKPAEEVQEAAPMEDVSEPRKKWWKFWGKQTAV